MSFELEFLSVISLADRLKITPCHAPLSRSLSFSLTVSTLIYVQLQRIPVYIPASDDDSETAIIISEELIRSGCTRCLIFVIRVMDFLHRFKVACGWIILRLKEEYTLKWVGKIEIFFTEMKCLGLYFNDSSSLQPHLHAIFVPYQHFYHCRLHCITCNVQTKDASGSWKYNVFGVKMFPAQHFESKWLGICGISSFIFWKTCWRFWEILKIIKLCPNILVELKLANMYYKHFSKCEVAAEIFGNPKT